MDNRAKYAVPLNNMQDADEGAVITLDAIPLSCSIWDEDHNNIYCNQEAARLFGLSEKQEYLERYHEFSPEYQPSGRLSAEMMTEYLTKAFSEGRSCFEWTHRKPDGELLPVEITLVRRKQSRSHIVVEFKRDLRELKTTLAQLEMERRVLKSVLDSSPVCFAILVDGIVRFASPSIKAFLGVYEHSRLSTFYAESGDGAAMEEELERDRVLNWRPVSFYTSSGELKHMLANMFFTQYYGEQGVMVWLMDVTDMREVEKNLRIARDAAEESTRSKSEFLANMSHEIRTPMNAILGMLQLMSHTDVSEKQRGYIEKTEHSARSLLRIINDILDFSKIEAGKLDMELVEFSLDHVLKGVTDMLLHRVNEKRLQFMMNRAPGIPDSLIGDPLRLNQILLNLVGNAVKFTSEGFVGIDIILSERRGSCVELEFSVSDSGIGMSREQMGKIFSPYTQADASVSRTFGGTGLGLVISGSLVKMMNGNIWCESVLGEGTTFHFTVCFELPRQGGSGEEERRLKAEKPKQIHLKEIKNAYILLAEDNEVNQIIAKELLELQGYSVDVANNGREAVDMVGVGNYNLVLMDIQMPEMDGLTAASEIRRQTRFEKLPIIAMTANAMAGDREKSLAAGMNDHVTKPIEASLLYETVRRWMSPEKGRA